MTDRLVTVVLTEAQADALAIAAHRGVSRIWADVTRGAADQAIEKVKAARRYTPPRRGTSAGRGGAKANG